MGSEIPKQFLIIKGDPVIVHSIRPFIRVYTDIKVCIVLGEGMQSTWNEIQNKYFPDRNFLIASGGTERFNSVKNALALFSDCNDDDLIAIHDSVRPLVNDSLVQRTFHAAASKKAITPAVPLKESVRRLDQGKSVSLDRKKLRIIQTPQVFQLGILRKAYEQEFRDSFTDDASVVESIGQPVHLVDGQSSNIKVTFKEDLAIAETLLSITS